MTTDWQKLHFQPDTRAQTLAHLARKERSALEAMARSIDIDPARYPNNRRGSRKLYQAVKAKIGQGMMRPDEQVIGDPFCFYLRGVCNNHREPYCQTFVAKPPNGRPIPLEEQEAIRAQFQNDPRVANCEECGEKITTWSSDMTRMSVWRDMVKQGIR